jgi:alpha-glucoside transport system permease protein
MVWMQTGFAMVVLSAALKGVPQSIKEAARIDGAGELRVIFSIVIPYIRGTIVMISTTILILTLKIWDIVFSMTNGLYGTEVLATQQYKQMFKFLNYGRGSAIAIVLLIAVVPVMWYNLRQFGKREVF